MVSLRPRLSLLSRKLDGDVAGMPVPGSAERWLTLRRCQLKVRPRPPWATPSGWFTSNLWNRPGPGSPPCIHPMPR